MKKEQTTLTVLALLLVANIVLAGFYGFVFYKIYLEKENIIKMTNTLAMESRRGAEIEILSSVVKETETERTKINSYFVGEKSTAKFLETVQSFGRRAGVEIRLNDVDIENKKTLRVDFSANGGFDDLYLLLKFMETTPYAISPKSINLSKINISGKGIEQLWSGDFSIRLVSFSGN